MYFGQLSQSAANFDFLYENNFKMPKILCIYLKCAGIESALKKGICMEL